MSLGCTSCGKHFNSLGLFDRHRVGKHHITVGADRRRCLTTEEMEARGWDTNEYGNWVDRTHPHPYAQARNDQANEHLP